MSKRFILLFLVVASVASSYGQEFTARYGIKGGINGNTLRNDFGLTKRRALGSHYGVLAEFMVLDKWSVQSEVFYSNQGMEGFFSTDDGDGRLLLEMAYIQVPLMARYYVTPRLSLQAGPQLGFLVNATAERGDIYYYENGLIEVVTGSNIKNQTRSLDLGLIFGASVDFNRLMSVDVRYNWGMLNTLKPIEGERVRSKNWVFQFGLAFKIPTF